MMRRKGVRDERNRSASGTRQACPYYIDGLWVRTIRASEQGEAVVEA